MFSREDFLACAEQNLRANLAASSAGELLLAGHRQYHTLWVRDFCFAVPGLLALGWEELVERELRLIFSFRRPGLPRGIDVRGVKWRVVRNTVLRGIPFDGRWPDGAELKPEYLGEHGTPAFDSNLLFLLAVAALRRRRSVEWISAAELTELLSFYSPYWRDGLLHQPAFSDWQDSVARKGPVLLSHLLYLLALREFPGLPGLADELGERVVGAFRHSGEILFREQPGRDLVCLDSHALLLCNPGILPGVEPEVIFRALRTHPIWKFGPGRPAFPDYSRGERSWTTRLIGMGGYHCEFVWGWLAAEAYRLCLRFGDSAESSRILDRFAAQVERDQTFWEVYALGGGALRPHRGFGYCSEGPFSWSAAKWVEVLAEEA